MSPAPVRPTPARLSRLRESDWYQHREGYPGYQAMFEPLTLATDQTHTKLEIILAGCKAVAEQGDLFDKRDLLVTRLELILRPGPVDVERRGIVLFSRQQAIVHVRDYLVGYGGTGPAFSERLFRFLGAGNLFDEINAVAGPRYHIIVSREETDIVEGVNTVLPYAKPQLNWRWWDAPSR